MSNPFYNYSGAFIPGTLARAEAEAAEFNSVQSGFSLLVTQGVDSGIVNAYVVTTQGQPTVAYVDGTTVTFKPLVTNTGASTLAVNAIPAASVLRFNGGALIPGDITGGVWTTAVYNSLLNAFTLTGAGQTAVIPGSISAAAPTHKVGLVASGGVSTQAAPIDATYAIDVTIAPTWSGAHTFAAGLTVSAGGLSVTNGSTILGAPTGGGQGTGTLNALGLFINGVAVTAGTGAGGVSSITGTANQIAASSSTGAVTLSFPVNVIIPVPVSGVSLTVQAVAGAQALVLNSPGAANFSRMDFQLAAATKGIIGCAGAANDIVTGSVQNDLNLRSTTNILFSANNGTTAQISLSANGNIVVAAPSSGNTLTVSGSAIQFVSKTTIARGSGTNWIDFQDPSGESAYLGYGSVNNNFSVQNILSGSLLLGTANTVNITVTSAGNVSISSPTSGRTLQVNAGANPIMGGIDNSNASGGYFAFSNSGTIQGYVGTGPNVITGAALADFCIASNTGALRFATGNGAGTNLLIGTAGNVSVLTPGSGNTLTVSSSVAGGFPLVINMNSASNDAVEMIDANSGGKTLRMGPATGGAGGALVGFYDNGAAKQRMGIDTNGMLTVQAPDSGVTVTLKSTAGATGPVIDFINGGSFTSAFRFGTNFVGTGTGTATLGGVKPGGNTTNSNWLGVLVGATQYYIPMWQ